MEPSYEAKPSSSRVLVLNHLPLFIGDFCLLSIVLSILHELSLKSSYQPYAVGNIIIFITEKGQCSKVKR